MLLYVLHGCMLNDVIRTAWMDVKVNIGGSTGYMEFC